MVTEEQESILSVLPSVSDRQIWSDPASKNRNDHNSSNASQGDDPTGELKTRITIRPCLVYYLPFRLDLVHQHLVLGLRHPHLDRDDPDYRRQKESPHHRY